MWIGLRSRSGMDQDEQDPVFEKNRIRPSKNTRIPYGSKRHSLIFIQFI